MGVGANVVRTDRQIVTICGSMRFWDQMVLVAESLTRSGHIVLAPFVDARKLDEEDEKVKAALDRLHRDKIEMSTKIMVVMVDNYIGDSTQAEISFAAAEGKKIEFRNFPSLKASTGQEYNRPKEKEMPKVEARYNGGKVFANGVEVDPETLKPLPGISIAGKYDPLSEEQNKAPSDPWAENNAGE